MILNESKKHKKIEPEHMQLMKEIGNRIKKLRTEKNLGYIEMSMMIGLSRNEYNLIELGQVYFKFSTLLRILDYHKISFSNFIKEL